LAIEDRVAEMREDTTVTLSAAGEQFGQSLLAANGDLGRQFSVRMAGDGDFASQKMKVVLRSRNGPESISKASSEPR
jgi:hypothetical protein